MILKQFIPKITIDEEENILKELDKNEVPKR